MKKFIVLIIVCVFSSFSAFALDQDKSAKEYVSRVAKGIFDVVSNKSMSLDEQKKILVDKFIDEIDFNWNARAACGRIFREMTDEQKKDFVKYYKQFLIRVWLPKFKGYQNETYFVGEEVEIGVAGDKMVPVKINLNDGKYVTIELRVRKNDTGYKILNISAEGIDMAKTYNAQFTEYADKYGVSELISYLKTGKSKDENKKA